MVALVIGTLLVVRAVLSRPVPPRPPFVASPGTPPPDPVHELDLRYARGGIGRDEYLQRRADLTGQSPPPGPTATPA